MLGEGRQEAEVGLRLLLSPSVLEAIRHHVFPLGGRLGAKQALQAL